MAKWRFHLNIADIWEQGINREITPRKLGEEIVKRIKSKLPKYFQDDDELLNIFDEMEMLSEDATFDDFDFIWSMLYDWADYNRVWMETH